MPDSPHEASHSSPAKTPPIAGKRYCGSPYLLLLALHSPLSVCLGLEAMGSPSQVAWFDACCGGLFLYGVSAAVVSVAAFLLRSKAAVLVFLSIASLAFLALVFVGAGWYIDMPLLFFSSLAFLGPVWLSSLMAGGVFGPKPSFLLHVALVVGCWIVFFSSICFE